MKFHYILNGSGWAKGFIEINSQRCEFNPSYLTNTLGDLLDSLVELLTYETNPKKGDLILYFLTGMRNQTV